MTNEVTQIPDVMDGEPCVAGTRIPVSCIASFAGQGVDAIKREYPFLSDRQIAAALAYRLSAQPAPVGELGKLPETAAILMGFATIATALEREGKPNAALYMRTAAQALTAMQAQLDEAREALRFYAENGENCQKLGGIPEGDKARDALSQDAGKRAKAALAEGGGA